MLGRPTKLTAKVQEAIADAVTGAASYKAAAMHAGVSETTFHVWLARGRAERDRLAGAEAALQGFPARARSDAARQARVRAERACTPLTGEAPYLAFLQRIELADAEGQVRAAGLVAKAGETDWRAAAWLLERRDPGTFGPPRQALEHTGPDGGPPVALVGLDIDFSGLTDDELEILQRIVSPRADS